MKSTPKLKSLRIEGLHGYKDVSLDFKDVTVIVGKNGMGKTTLLKIISSLLGANRNEPLISVCQKAEIRLTDNEVISFGFVPDDKKTSCFRR